MSGAGVYEPFVPLTPDNQGAAVIIVAYFLIATTTAFSTVRFLVGRQRLLSFDLDDAFYAVALVLQSQPAGGHRVVTDFPIVSCFIDIDPHTSGDPPRVRTASANDIVR